MSNSPRNIPPEFNQGGDFTYQDFRNLVKSVFRDIGKVFGKILNGVKYLLSKVLGVVNLSELPRTYKKSWLQHKNKLLILSLLGTIFFVARNVFNAQNDFKSYKVSYLSGLKFIVEESSMSTLGNISKSFLSEEELISPGQNVEVLNAILRKKIPVNDTLRILGNHYIDTYRLNAKWGIVEESSNFREFDLFNYRITDKKDEDLSNKDKNVLNYISSKILRDNLKISFDTTSKIFVLKADSHDGVLSSKLGKLYFDELSEQYNKGVNQLYERSIRVLEERSEEVFEELRFAGKEMEKVDDLLQKEKSKYIPDLFNVDVTTINPDDFLSKESILYFDLTSGKYTTINELYEDIVRKIDEFKFEFRNRTVKFRILDNDLIPSKKELVLSDMIKSRLFNIGNLLFFVKLLLYGSLILAVFVIGKVLAAQVARQ